MEEKELDLSYILQTIGKRFLLILLFVILGVGAAVFYNYGAPIIYQSKTTLYVQPEVESSEVDYEGILTNQKMVKTYTEIIKSRKIINKVKEELELDLSFEEIYSILNVTSLNDTEIITIVVSSEDPNLARDIANQTAIVFIGEIKETMEINNIKVIDEAIAGVEPVSPRILLNCLIGLAGGLFIGLALSFLIESMDNKIKNHEDIKKYLKIKTLGVVPHNSIDYEVSGKKKVYVNPNEMNLKIITDPTSVVSESIRMIRTNLNFLDTKLINVTSTVPSEGKSEVISNLALSFAMLDKKVLVVDCDLRKPKVHKNFGLTRKRGVSDLVLSKGTHHYKEAIQKYIDPTKKASIDILTAGSKISNPSELINNKGFANLLKELKEDYDVVLLDCPPISSLTDGVLVSKLCDGTVYVIESERTDHQVIESCIEELKNNQAFILGAILTKVNIKRQKKLYGYKYDYYYSNYNK